jgi:hypothetical protein
VQKKFWSSRVPKASSTAYAVERSFTDFWHSNNRSLKGYYGRNEKFVKDLSTAYAVEEAFGTLEDQNFFCTENEKAEVGEDGLITLTFERYS